MKVGELDGVEALFEVGGGGQLFGAATVAGGFVDNGDFVEMKLAAIHFEVELIFASGCDVEESGELNGGVLRDFAIARREGGEGEVGDLSGFFGGDVAGESFPDFSAPGGESEMPWDAGVLKEVVGDAFDVLAGEAEVGHTPGGTDGVRALQEFAERFVRVFQGEVTEGNGGVAKELGAFGIFGRVTGATPDGMEELVALLGGDGVGGFLFKFGAFAERDEVVGEFFGDGLFFFGAEMGGQAGHGGAWFNGMGRGDEGLEVFGIHAGAHGREAWGLARGGSERFVGAVAGDTVHFLQQDTAFKGGFELGGLDSGEDDLGVAPGES